MNIQVEPRHYRVADYDTKGRFASYWHQAHEVVSLRPRRVLEIGLGNGFLSRHLRGVGIEVLTVDIDARLRPDVVASVTHLPFGIGSFDVVTAFQVLEHLPFEQFAPSVAELSRVAADRLVISLPDRRWYVRLALALYPSLDKSRGFTLGGWMPRRHRFDGEHHWEIGRRGCAAGKIAGSLRSHGWEIAKEYRVPEKPIHHFYVLAR